MGISNKWSSDVSDQGYLLESSALVEAISAKPTSAEMRHLDQGEMEAARVRYAVRSTLVPQEWLTEHDL